MERRKFILDTIAHLPIIALAPAILASSCSTNDKDNKNKSIIVIGAGISGLAAAKKLKEEDFNVTILESQDRVGGRIRTNRSLGVAFDEGASRIHGTKNNPLTDLANDAGMNTAFTDDDSVLVYDIGGFLRSDGSLEKAEEEYYEILETLKNSGNKTQSFETVFNTLHPDKTNDRLWKYILSTYLTFDLGDLDKISSLLYDEGEVFGGEERISINGYDTIPTYLAQHLNVILNQRVSKIDYTGAKVLVTHNGVVSEADYVIVTVPLGVLKKNVIDFVPSLPQTKQNAIQKVGMGCVNKFLLTWDITFWDDVQYIAYTPDIRDKFNYFVNVKKFNPSVNALMTFAYADAGRQTETMSDSQVINEIMTHLKDIYGHGIPQPKNMLRTKWNSNENAYGAYCFTAIETEMSHFDDLAADVDNKLFFAGEHTLIDYFSNAHGAYLSGLREADKISKL
jgi:monoamine oxidase